MTAPDDRERWATALIDVLPTVESSFDVSPFLSQLESNILVPYEYAEVTKHSNNRIDQVRLVFRIVARKNTEYIKKFVEIIDAPGFNRCAELIRKQVELTPLDQQGQRLSQGAMLYADGPPFFSVPQRHTANTAELEWQAYYHLGKYYSLAYGLPSASHGRGHGWHVPTIADADRPPTSNIPQEPPPSSVPQEPPPSSVPQEPPPSSVPQEPPPSSVPQEPPSSSVPQEPSPSSVPQEPPPSNGEVVPDGPEEEDVLKATMMHIAGVLQNQYCRRPGNEVAIPISFGQKSVPFHQQVKIASAVCRTVWSSQMHGTDSFGTGSFVSSDGKFYLLTCCHNFLSKEDGDKLIEPGKEDADVVSTLKVNYMKEEMKNRCKRTKYHCFNKDFNGTVPLPANVVLANPDDPVLIFNMELDLLAVEVKNPADFPCPIQPIPLLPSVSRESLLESALLLTIVHFPHGVNHRAGCLEFAVGLRLIQGVCQDTQVVYAFDAFHGSSGSPVLFVREGEVVLLLAVHRKSTQAKMRDETGQLTNTAYNIGSVLTQDFLKHLLPNV